jgi:cellulose synthase/poly-beta-1,6-N-acetylglucosamine synthase-like glycosyltransferase
LSDEGQVGGRGVKQGAVPVEIAFLADHGVSPIVLRRAAAIAASAGVSAEQALLRHGLMREDDFYRCLARSVGAEFIDEDIALDSRVNFPASILAGIVPLRASAGSARFALAPSASALKHLVEQGPGGVRGVAITTPTALRRAVFEARGPSITSHASHALPYARPEHSYRDGASWRQIAGSAAAVAAVAAAATYDVGLATAALAMLLTPIFLAMVVLRIAAARDAIPTSPKSCATRRPDRLLPVYSILVPLYRERRVLRQLVDALSRLDYPAAKLDVKLIVEEGDGETRSALDRIALPGFFEVVVAPAGEPRTKPRALNVALPLARGEYTVIYDAEDVPDPDQLRLAIATFARQPQDVACLQARLVIDNTGDNWLTRLFTIEYAALFDVINPGLAALRCPVPLGGTSNHFRTTVLKAVGGWDAWNVTEDADLGIRLALMGYRVADLPSSTLEEAPGRPRAWMRQRARWMKGFLQVCVTHSRHPWRALRVLGPVQFFGAMTMTAGTVLAALGFPFFTVLSVYGVATGRLLGAEHWTEAVPTGIALTLFVSGFAAMMLPAVPALSRRGWWDLAVLIPWLPVYYLMISIGAWRGVAEFVVAPFRWNKTDHGLARTSRLRRSSGPSGPT